jgi:tripartite-type tricarboxylate transporter receptor subunit TctC
MKAIIAALFFALAGVANAQSWPTKPVRVLIAQPPGAGPDIMARLLSDRLGNLWGQSVVVENRAGGASIPGTMAAVQAAPDGYTYYMATGGVLLNVYTFKQLPYDPDKQLVPVAFIGKAPFMLSVHPGVPANNLNELVAYLKANPGKLAIATEGPRNLGGMMAEYFMALTGTRMTHVPYNGAAAGLTATIAGQAQVTMQSATATTPHARAGKLRPIVVTSGNPVPGFENVPPLKNTFGNFEYVGWYMLYAPTGTPDAIVQRVNRDLDRVMKEPETAKKLSDLGPILEGAGTPESLRAFHRQEHENWARLTKAINFQPE